MASDPLKNICNQIIYEGNITLCRQIFLSKFHHFKTSEHLHTQEAQSREARMSAEYGLDGLFTLLVMMTSLNGRMFRVTGPLCREFTGHRWIPLTKASDTAFWCFFDLRMNKRLRKESPSRPLWRYCSDISRRVSTRSAVNKLKPWMESKHGSPYQTFTKRASGKKIVQLWGIWIHRI